MKWDEKRFIPQGLRSKIKNQTAEPQLCKECNHSKYHHKNKYKECQKCDCFSFDGIPGVKSTNELQ